MWDPGRAWNIVRWAGVRLRCGGKCFSRRAVMGPWREGVVLIVRTKTCSSCDDVRGWCSSLRLCFGLGGFEVGPAGSL